MNILHTHTHTPFDRSAVEAVLRPAGEARGLPNEFYTSKATYEFEKQAVLAASWTAVGFGKDLPQRGDVKPVDFLGAPLLLARDHDGEIQVYLNACRHRGMKLIEEPRRIEGAIRCPYHSWCYDLKGHLRATPHVGGPGQNTAPEIDREALGLTKIRFHIWFDIIFVNLDGTAHPFEEEHADLLERWAEFDRPIHHGGQDSSFKLAVKTNWKLAVENYCESYHLPWVHPGLNSYSRLEDHYNIVEYGQYSGQGTLVYSPQLDDTGRKFSDFSGLSEKWDKGAEYVALYPNTLLGVHRDHVFAIILEPKSECTTVEHVEIYYTDQEMCDGSYTTLRERNAELWKGIFIEDIFVVEGMQKGRYGGVFDGGKFSQAMDEPTHCFHEWVARKVMAAL